MSKILLLLLMAVGIAAGQPANHNVTQVTRWRQATVPPHRVRSVQVIVDRIQKNQARYEAVSKSTGVPFYVIASLHNMEASGNFSMHLHEGSSLRARTRYVPKGRPKTGTPPFTWEYSAADAMVYDNMGAKRWNDLGASLSACEGYNGWGYAKFHPSTPTPYLWAATSVEKPGRYVADGNWSSTARSQQIGVSSIWKEMERRRLVKLPVK